MATHSNAERERVAGVLAEKAFEDIATKYGQLGHTPKEGHDERHARASYRAGILIVEAAIESGRIEPHYKSLVMIACANHDRVLDLVSGKNERASAAIARADMSEYSIFSFRDMGVVSRAIIGTTVQFQGLRMFQTPGADKISKIVADADLANLGSENDIFVKNSARMFAETHPDGHGAQEFINFQRVLLAEHEFYTPEAKILFPNQTSNLMSLDY